jgi:AraC-like DNA-binding protein
MVYHEISLPPLPSCMRDLPHLHTPLPGSPVQVELLARQAYSASDPVRMHTLGIALERQCGVHAIGSDRRQDFDTWPGALSYTPPGVDVFSESPVGGEYLVLRWAADDAAPSTGMRQRLTWTGQAQALAVSQRLRRALLGSAPDSLAVEEACWALLAIPASQPHRPEPALQALYQRVLDRIHAEFDRPLTLAELAAAEGLQPLQLLRGFTRQVGMTPHAFIVETRVQAVRAALRADHASLADIALACGCSHQSHMGAAFRKLLGLTPTQYRQQHVKPLHSRPWALKKP